MGLITAARISPALLISLFNGRNFYRLIIILCVRRRIDGKLSYLDLGGMMADRGASLSHTIILRRVQFYIPDFKKHWRRYA